MNRFVRKFFIVGVLLLSVVMMIQAPVQGTSDICKGNGIAQQTCSSWQVDLINACYVNFPNGGPGYQKCLDDSWDSYVTCMGLFGCPVTPRIVNP